MRRNERKKQQSSSPKMDPALAAQLEEKNSHRKGSVFERLTDEETGNSGVVRVDKSRHHVVFYAEHGQEGAYVAVESQNPLAVRAWLLVQLGKPTASMLLDWVPVIEVEDKSDVRREYYGRDDGDLYGSCALSVDRYYLALTLDKTEWLKLSWEECNEESPTMVEPGERFRASTHFRDGPGVKREPHRHYNNDKPFTLPFFEGARGDSSTSFMRYTPELWAGLETIVKTLHDMRADLKKILGTKAGIAAITSLGEGTAQLRLGSGKPVQST